MGGTDAFLDHLSYFGYLLPPLTVVLARRLRWSDPRPVSLAIGAIILSLFLLHDGGRRLVGMFFGSAAVVWFLGARRIRFMTVVGLVLLVVGLWFTLETMLKYRGVGLRGMFDTSREAEYIPDEDGVLVRVDDNFIRLAQTTAIFPDEQPYTTWRYVLWVAVRPIPRVFWPGKPVSPGFDLAEYTRHQGTSLSSSVIGELFMAGGFIAVALGGWFYGGIARLLSSLLATTGTSGAILVYGIGLFALFIGMRSMIELVLMNYVVLAWILLGTSVRRILVVKARLTASRASFMNPQPPVTQAISRDTDRADPRHEIRVVFCWTVASGYMAACWRALANRPGVDLHVVHLRSLKGAATGSLLEPSLLDGISHDLLPSSGADDGALLLDSVLRRRPHVVVLCGWLHKPYLRLLNGRQLDSVRLIVGMDSPWQGTISQRLARLRLARLVRRLDAVVTSGDRSREYALRLGVPENRIRTGYYGFDFGQFSGVAATRSRAPGNWPRRFLFVGRYAPEKDLSTLVAAYSSYRESVSNPWGLTCCGSGVDRRLLEGVPGVIDAGFIQPRELAGVFGQHGAFVLASRFEPWGVVLAEAAASGLPVICTTACGAGVDVVRPYYNGLVVAPGDSEGLANAMGWIHEHEAELPAIGRRGVGLAAAYSAEAWASRWHHYLLDAVCRPRA